MADPRHELGRRAEDACAAWLGMHGWDVLARRLRPGHPGGEVDLVAVDPDGWLVGVEVRARRTARTGEASVTVDGRRIDRIRRSLANFAAGTRARHIGLRVDLVTAEPDTIGAGLWRLRRIAGLEAAPVVSRRRALRAP